MGEWEPGRLRGVLAWVGLGLLLGGLLWVVVTAVVAGTGWWERADGWWVLSALIALLVLARGVRWRRGGPETETPRYVFWMCPATGTAVLAAGLAFPRDAFEVTAPGPWAFDASPVAVHMWLVTCAITLGCVLVLVGWRRPDPRPLRRTLPALVIGVLAVSLAGVLVARFLVPWVPHAVADGLGEPASVPSEVARVGWEWRSPMGARVDEVRPGTHGPLILLRDGALALDGETGEELWSYRRPHDRVEDVWAEDAHVYVRHGADADDSGEEREEQWETVVLDAGTGRVLDEVLDAEVPSTGWMNEHGRALVDELLDLPEHCVVSRARSYGHDLVGVFGCLEEADEETVERSVETGNAFGWEHVRTRATVVALNPLEGTELWSTEWTASPSAAEPSLDQVPGGAAAPPVIVRDGPDGRTVVLDPQTGGELVAQPEELVDGDDRVELVHADADGAVFASDRGELRNSFHRTTPSGTITDTAVVERAHLMSAVGTSRIAVLGDSLVVTLDRDFGGLSKLVLSVPFGESTHLSDGVILELEREGDLEVVVAPGTAVLVSQSRDSTLLEGLVP